MKPDQRHPSGLSRRSPLFLSESLQHTFWLQEHRPWTACQALHCGAFYKQIQVHNSITPFGEGFAARHYLTAAVVNGLDPGPTAGGLLHSCGGTLLQGVLQQEVGGLDVTVHGVGRVADSNGLQGAITQAKMMTSYKVLHQYYSKQACTSTDLSNSDDNLHRDQTLYKATVVLQTACDVLA